MISPEFIQTWAGAVAALGGAILSISGVAALVYVNFPKGRAAFTKWWHETTGAGQAIVELQGLRADLQSLRQVQEENHDANTAKALQQEKEMAALVELQDKQAKATKTLADELTLEAEARERSLEQVSENLARVATIADTALARFDRHERNRTKHPPQPRRKKETAA